MKEHAIATAKLFSKCSEARLENTWGALKRVDEMGVEGDFVECGVWKGGNVMIASMASPERRCWLFDTFDGMTDPGPHDMKSNGMMAEQKKEGKWAACDIDEVYDNLKTVGVYSPGKFRFVKGDVCTTLPAMAMNDDLPEKIAVLRLDTDFYESTRAEMICLYPRLQSGGILIVDDYNHWMGAKKAVNEYLGKKAKHLNPIDDTGVWMVKP